MLPEGGKVPRRPTPISANLRQDSFAVGGQPVPAEIGRPATGTSGFPQADFSMIRSAPIWITSGWPTTRESMA
jgi:hypothetical protein